MKIFWIKRHWSIIAVQIACVLAILLIWMAPVPRLRILQITKADDIHALALPQDVPITSMEDLVLRPVFSQTRRPQPAPQTALKTQVIPKVFTPTIDGMVLLGILHVDTKAVALVTSPGDTYPKQVIKGSMIGGWQIMDILKDRLILRSGQTTAILIIPPLQKLGNSVSQPPQSVIKPSSQVSLPFFGIQ